MGPLDWFRPNITRRGARDVGATLEEAAACGGEQDQTQYKARPPHQPQPHYVIVFRRSISLSLALTLSSPLPIRCRSAAYQRLVPEKARDHTLLFSPTDFYCPVPSSNLQHNLGYAAQQRSPFLHAMRNETILASISIPFRLLVSRPPRSPRPPRPS